MAEACKIVSISCLMIKWQPAFTYRLYVCRVDAYQYHRLSTHLAARDMVRYPLVEYLWRQVAMKGGYIYRLKLSLIKRELDKVSISLQGMTMGHLSGRQLLSWARFAAVGVLMPAHWARKTSKAGDRT